MKSLKINIKIDHQRCPLCGENNHCAEAINSQDFDNCWCKSKIMTFPNELIKQVSIEQRNKACICQKCAQTFNEQSK
ncbi:cysteine-rich CWC family protein [Marinicella rhabdoformis]|uniref:cysteine-rich CWC family protein n=1 Tax=Marinicella rhabdoformis TaxID=2580566 RepID=UPI003CCE3EF4